MGASDPLVRHVAGPEDAPFPSLFSAADFQAARAGSGATITNRRSVAWLSSLSADPIARWVTTSPADHSGLYAIDFDVPEIVVRATLDLTFAVDDALGAGSPQTNGICINGQAVVGPLVWGHFTTASSVTREVGPLIRRGNNTLYVALTNRSGVSIWSISIPPEPSLVQGGFFQQGLVLDLPTTSSRLILAQAALLLGACWCGGAPASAATHYAATALSTPS